MYCETLANPLLQVPELDALAAFAGEHGLVSMVDNTFATPLLFRPCTRGFTLSLHSATKYLNGHSDVVAGVVVGSTEAVATVHARLNLLGGSLDPQAAWLLHRGLKTLPLRLHQQLHNARAVANWLAAHPAVAAVHYPGLPEPPRPRARRPPPRRLRRDDRHGAATGGKAAAVAAHGARAPLPAGGEPRRRGVPGHPPGDVVPRAGMAPADREALGVTEGLLRLSIGIEDAEDLIADLGQALG